MKKIPLKKKPLKRRRSKKKKFIELIPPEGVPIRFQIASVGDRLTALVTDVIIVISSVVLFVLLLVGLGIFLGFSSGGFFPSLLSSLFILGLFFLRQGYFFFFELKWQGSTPGKRLAKLRVVSRSGSSLTVGSIVARNLFRDLEIFMPLGILFSPAQLKTLPIWVSLPMLGWLGVMIAIPLVNKQNLRLGDLVAGTMVIRIPTAELLRDKAARTASFRSPHQENSISFTSKQLSFYGEYELETLVSILHRADEGRADEFDLRIIANTIARKIGYTGHEVEHFPERFLRIFYSEQRAHLEKKLLLGKRKADKFSKQ